MKIERKLMVFPVVLALALSMVFVRLAQFQLFPQRSVQTVAGHGPRSAGQQSRLAKAQPDPLRGFARGVLRFFMRAASHIERVAKL
ncbi:MAG: hypothetical protein ACOYON_07315 [Fimbriimonas sp.]